jgi:hypothetical protein
MRKANRNRKGNLTARKLWIGIGILVLLSPLGIIIPSYLGAGGAWGEWSLEQIEKMAGFAPEGMKRMADIWKAPMINYAGPGQAAGPVHSSLGYIVAGIIGISATAGLMYLFTRLLVRKDGSSKHNRQARR